MVSLNHSRQKFGVWKHLAVTMSLASPGRACFCVEFFKGRCPFMDSIMGWTSLTLSGMCLVHLKKNIKEVGQIWEVSRKINQNYPNQWKKTWWNLKVLKSPTALIHLGPSDGRFFTTTIVGSIRLRRVSCKPGGSNLRHNPWLYTFIWILVESTHGIVTIIYLHLVDFYGKCR